MDRQGFKTFCRTRLTSETLDNDDKRTLTSSFAIHLLLFFFFYKDQRRKDGSVFETDTLSNFRNTLTMLPLRWRAKTYSALSLDWINFLIWRVCYHFPGIVLWANNNSIFLTHVKWLSNRVYCTCFRSPTRTPYNKHLIGSVFSVCTVQIPGWKLWNFNKCPSMRFNKNKPEDEIIIKNDIILKVENLKMCC